MKVTELKGNVVDWDGFSEKIGVETQACAMEASVATLGNPGPWEENTTSERRLSHHTPFLAGADAESEQGMQVSMRRLAE